MTSAIEREKREASIYEMMERLGIERGGGAIPILGLRYATAFHRCESCQCKVACRDWLDRGTASARLAPRFCPNADILLELQVEGLPPHSEG